MKFANDFSSGYRGLVSFSNKSSHYFVSVLLSEDIQFWQWQVFSELLFVVRQWKRIVRTILIFFTVSICVHNFKSLSRIIKKRFRSIDSLKIFCHLMYLIFYITAAWERHLVVCDGISKINYLKSITFKSVYSVPSL